jgi:hypothetical protein
MTKIALASIRQAVVHLFKLTTTSLKFGDVLLRIKSVKFQKKSHNIPANNMPRVSPAGITTKLIAFVAHE